MIGVKQLVDPIVVPIPLADGTAATLHLPKVLSHSDAEKIARVVKAMAVDTQPTKHDEDMP